MELNEPPIDVILIIDPAREETYFWIEFEENCRVIDYLKADDRIDKKSSKLRAYHAMEKW